ncbi:STAS domain-containing protein [Fictibacillus nanhaiensis]|uniref:STAS domain-containing protein n=1 Tax=Fictibacillus nanhaiensis TaxID=742169 RepID=UPI002E1BB181|nr:STAS domain-containing protein [Fictibacillus nanhaiensis]
MSTSLYYEQLNCITDRIFKQMEVLADQRFIADENVYSKINNEKLLLWRIRLIKIYADSISEDIQTSYENLKEWGNDTVNLLVEMSLPLDTAIEEVRFYRNTIGEIIKDEAISQNFSLELLYEVLTRFDSVVDRAVHWLSLSYNRMYSIRIGAAEATALELSIPVIKITESIGVIPLVGDIDTKRANELMDKALTQSIAYDLEHVIMDLSGVPVIDTMVADQIFKVMEALRLIGITVYLSGIRSEIAQTMVLLGINFKDLSTYASLHHAFESINK